MSSSARCTCASCEPTFTPPTWSAWFSLLASQRAALLEAPLWLSANTLAPRASGVVKASAWMLTNRSACTRRAFCTRMLQRHEEVGVAREEGAHRVAVDAAGVDAVAQPVRDLQHDVFLARAAGADGARVLAAMAGVERDDDDAVGAARGGGACRCVRAAAAWRADRRRDGGGAGRATSARRAAAAMPARGRIDCCAISSPSGSGGRRRGHAPAQCALRRRLRPGLGRIAQALGDQRFQRVDGLLRIEVEHQPVLVGRHRRAARRPAAATGCLRSNTMRTTPGANWPTRRPLM